MATRHAEEESDAATTKRTIGAPRVQETPAAGTGRKPTAGEIKARQEAIRETRRPTKPPADAAPALRGTRAVRGFGAPDEISVPDIAPSECEERDE